MSAPVSIEWDPPEPGASKLHCRLPVKASGISITIEFDVWWHDLSQMHYALKEARATPRNPRKWYEKAGAP